MPEFESPTYVLALNHRSNCSSIESAKPGIEIRVLVRPEHDPTAQPIVAKGTLRKDCVFFDVTVTTTDGAQQTHSWNYEILKEAITVYKPEHP